MKPSIVKQWNIEYYSEKGENISLWQCFLTVWYSNPATEHFKVALRPFTTVYFGGTLEELEELVKYGVSDPENICHSQLSALHVFLPKKKYNRQPHWWSPLEAATFLQVQPIKISVFFRHKMETFILE